MQELSEGKCDPGKPGQFAEWNRFFDGNGMPKLMNRRMHQICMNLAGRDIQNITELEEALSKPLKEQVFFDDDLKVYGFSDGSVWKFSEKEIITTGGDRFSQVLASEVSELYQSKVLLKRENQKLQEMSCGYERTLKKCCDSDQRRRDIIYENAGA